MTSKREDKSSRIVPYDMRDHYRQKQIEAIKAETRKKYAERIKAAQTRKEKRALKAERDAEIARLTEPLLREREKDTPSCL